MKDFLSNPFFRFISVACGLYLLWYVSYEFYLKPATFFDAAIIGNLVWLTEHFLQFLSFDLIVYESELYSNYVGIEGSPGVIVGAPCDGLILLVLFLVFVVSFPGSFKHKLWFVPLGMYSIHIINAIRITCLAIIVNYRPEWLQFNHDYTFTILVYAYVFFLWYLWVSYFSPLKKSLRVHEK